MTPPDFAVATRRFLQDQITLADSKAAAVSTVSIAVLAYLLRSGAGAAWHRALPAWGWDSLLGLGAVLGLGAGLVGSLAVVLPRVAGGSEGHVYWRAILGHPTPGDYARAVRELDDRELETTLLEDCHRLSGICARKFAVLHRSMWSASVGLLLALLWLALFSDAPPAGGGIAEHPPQLPVIGASAETRIHNVLFGSIPDRIADRAPCSVLMARRYLPEHWSVRLGERFKRFRGRPGWTTSPDEGA